MEKQAETHIEIRTGNGYFNRTCVFCGGPYETGLTWAELVSGGEDCGEICPDCLAAGPEGMAERMRAYAERQRGYAAWLAGSAVEIAELPANEWPTMAEYGRHNDHAEIAVRHFSDIDFYFGVCPECGDSEMRNVERNQYGVCPEHKVYWGIGSGLFSGWRYENETIWEENVRFLEACEEIEPAYSVTELKHPPNPAHYVSGADYMHAYEMWHSAHSDTALWAPADAHEIWRAMPGVAEADDIPF